MAKNNPEKLSLWERSIKPGDKVLDIGCWSGARVKKLVNRGVDAYGADIDKKKLDMAEKSVRGRLFLADATKKLPFKKEFDWAFCTEVIEHVKGDDKVIENISRVLKPGGRLVLTTPKKISGLDFWDPAWVRWKFGGERHWHYSKRELFTKLRKYGFEVEEYGVQGSLAWLFCRWVNVFLKYVLRSKMQINKKMGLGYFDWEILARLRKE